MSSIDGMERSMECVAYVFYKSGEGSSFTKYAKSGSTVINSWFRTAQEQQPSTNGMGVPYGPNVWVGAMWMSSPGAAPANDHIWGHGSVSADPKINQGYTLNAMWTTC